MAIRLGGKAANDLLKEEIALKAAKLKVTPKLALIRVGNNENDLAYENSLLKKAAALKIAITVYPFADNAKEAELLALIAALNKDCQVHGIMIFRPLPKHLNEYRLLSSIDPLKDVDCAGERALSKLLLDRPGFYPCTAEAVIRLLDHYAYELQGKKVVVIGRSLVVGKPLSLLLLKRNATVTICHSKTEDLKKECQTADIVISCMGQSEFLDEHYFKDTSVVIDVGVVYNPQKDKITGDVDYEKVFPRVAALSPVPGGVGMLTSTILLSHVVAAAGELC